MPMLALVRRQARDIGAPASVISPDVGASKPASIISVVVLPEPGRPEQRQEFAARDLEVEVLHHESCAVIALVDAARTARRLRRLLRLRLSSWRSCVSASAHALEAGGNACVDAALAGPIVAREPRPDLCSARGRARSRLDLALVADHAALCRARARVRRPSRCRHSPAPRDAPARGSDRDRPDRELVGIDDHDVRLGAGRDASEIVAAERRRRRRGCSR